MTRSPSSASPTSSPSSSPRSAARHPRAGCTPISRSAADAHPRFLNAGNEGPFTLDGTRTYLVGDRTVAIIDPGPADGAHTSAVVAAVAPATAVSVLVTHGHPDHAAGAPALVAALAQGGISADVRGPRGLEVVSRALAHGDAVATDEGDLVAIETPGHARAHLAFHWPERRALFAGDLLLGKGDTVWVGEYPGAVADYLRSLERIRELDLRVIYPAHGPALTDPPQALDRYVAHRRERIRQVEAALEERPGAGAEELLDMVYGAALPTTARRAALMSMVALKAHVEGPGDGG